MPRGNNELNKLDFFTALPVSTIFNISSNLAPRDRASFACTSTTNLQIMRTYSDMDFFIGITSTNNLSKKIKKLEKKLKGFPDHYFESRVRCRINMQPIYENAGLTYLTYGLIALLSRTDYFNEYVAITLFIMSFLAAPSISFLQAYSHAQLNQPLLPNKKQFFYCHFHENVLDTFKEIWTSARTLVYIFSKFTASAQVILNAIFSHYLDECELLNVTTEQFKGLCKELEDDHPISKLSDIIFTNLKEFPDWCEHYLPRENVDPAEELLVEHPETREKIIIINESACNEILSKFQLLFSVKKLYESITDIFHVLDEKQLSLPIRDLDAFRSFVSTSLSGAVKALEEFSFLFDNQNNLNEITFLANPYRGIPAKDNEVAEIYGDDLPVAIIADQINRQAGIVYDDDDYFYDAPTSFSR